MKLSKPICIGLLLSAIGILSTTTTSGQSRRDGRKGDSGNRMKMMMERLDTNKDGVITSNEFKGPKERFDRMDKNGDGKVDSEELSAMQKRMQQSGRQGGNRRGGNRKGGDVMTQRHGPDKSPEVGEETPDFTLKLLHSDQSVKFSDVIKKQPVVLTLGSYTCPPYRNALEGIEKLSKQYGEEFAFYFVYIKEAHATDERPSRSNEHWGIDFKKPTTYLERESIAKTCKQQIKLTMPILVDTLDNSVEKLFAGAPNRTYLIDQNGIVKYKGVRGPQGTRPDDIEKAIQKHLGTRTR